MSIVIMFVRVSVCQPLLRDFINRLIVRQVEFLTVDELNSLNPFSTGYTIMCSWEIVHIDIILHVVHFGTHFRSVFWLQWQHTCSLMFTIYTILSVTSFQYCLVILKRIMLQNSWKFPRKASRGGDSSYERMLTAFTTIRTTWRTVNTNATGKTQQCG